MFFIYFIIFIIISALVIFLMLGASILRLFGKRTSGSNSQSGRNYNNNRNSSNNTQEHKKIFSKEEGEYTDFEEIE